MFKLILLQRMHSAFEQRREKYTETFLNKFVYSSIFGRIFASKKGLNDI